MACGGGGGGGATAAAPTTQNPPTNTPDPMNPPTTTPDPMPPTITLPGYAITNLDMARTAVSGSAPSTSMTETQIVTAIQTRATAADTFEFRGFAGTSNVDITCTNNSSCSGTVPDVGSLTFSLNDIEDLSLVDDTDLIGFDSDTQLVMEDRGVTMIQSEAAAGQNDGTHLTFQTYGGWLTNSVFGVTLLGVTEGATTTNRSASFSFGDASGNNPTTGNVIGYAGVMIGMDTRTNHVLHGDAIIQFLVGNSNLLESVTFQNITNLSGGSNVDIITFNNIPLSSNGTFESNSGDIKGTFYGTGHEGIGGIFDKDNILAAFGAVRQ